MKKSIFLSIFLLATSAAAAQEINVVERRAPQAVPFAQPFALQFILSHTPGYEVTLDEDSLSKDFEITQLSSSENSPGTVSYDVTAQPFILGKSTFTVTFNLVQNGKTFASAPEEIFIDVARAKTFNDPNLREIRSPHIPASWLMWLLALLLLAALGYTGYYWYKRLHERARRVDIPEDTRPGNVIALSKIDALLDSGLWENQQYNASADTSAELLRRVKAMPQMAPLMYQLREFLSSGDLVKFAKAIPNEQIRDKDVTALRKIIVETAPKELAPAADKEEK